MRFTFRLFGEEVVDIEIGGQANDELAELENIIENFVEDEDEEPLSAPKDHRDVHGLTCSSCGELFVTWRDNEEPSADSVILLHREHICNVQGVLEWLKEKEEDDDSF